jgi:hypothetical protein
MYDLFRSVLGTGEHLRCIKEVIVSVILFLLQDLRLALHEESM